MPASEQGWRVSRGPLENERNSWRLGDYFGAALKKIGMDAGNWMASPRFPCSATMFPVRIWAVT